MLVWLHNFPSLKKNRKMFFSCQPIQTKWNKTKISPSRFFLNWEKVLCKNEKTHRTIWKTKNLRVLLNFCQYPKHFFCATNSDSYETLTLYITLWILRILIEFSVFYVSYFTSGKEKIDQSVQIFSRNIKKKK